MAGDAPPTGEGALAVGDVLIHLAAHSRKVRPRRKLMRAERGVRPLQLRAEGIGWHVELIH